MATTFEKGKFYKTKELLWEAVEQAVLEGMPTREFAVECYECWSQALTDLKTTGMKEADEVFLDWQRPKLSG